MRSGVSSYIPSIGEKGGTIAIALRNRAAKTNELE